MPTPDHPDPDAPRGVVPYPALDFAALRWLNQRSGGPTGCFPDLPKVMTPLFYDQIDQTQPIAVLRTHRETTTARYLKGLDASGGGVRSDDLIHLVEDDPHESLIEETIVELLVAICSFAPREPGPRLINELLCHPDDYDRVVGMTILLDWTPREFHTLKQYGMFGDSIPAPPNARPQL
ncbi:MAG: hypothetical protein ACR2JV_03025 [Gaiellales bacterium]